jgi:cytochrome P450
MTSMPPAAETLPPAETRGGRTAPGPRGHWLWGCWPRLWNDPLDWYYDTWRTHGDVVRIRFLPGAYGYLLTHPDAIEHVLQKHHKNYRKPTHLTRTLGLLIGEGLFNSEGESWLRHRRLMQPAFHRQHLARLSRHMVAAAEDCLRQWAQAGAEPVLDVAADMMRLSLRIAGVTLFGADLGREADAIGRTFRSGLEHVIYRLNTPTALPPWVPTARNRRFARDQRTLERVVLDLIAERRRRPGEGGDLLALLLAAQDEETGAGLTDREVLDEALTLLAAGHDTVGAALAWTWYLLGRHPEVQEAVHDEVRGLLRGRSPTFDDLPQLPLVRAAFEEAMRLYPPAPGVVREAIEDDVVLGYRIPRRVVLILSSYVTHRRPDLWDEPERFKPERFLAPQSAPRPKFAYFPFGGGPRVCIGNTFALAEGPLVLATLIQACRVELIPDHVVLPDQRFTLRPKNGVMVKMRRRPG